MRVSFISLIPLKYSNERNEKKNEVIGRSDLVKKKIGKK